MRWVACEGIEPLESEDRSILPCTTGSRPTGMADTADSLQSVFLTTSFHDNGQEGYKEWTKMMMMKMMVGDNDDFFRNSGIHFESLWLIASAVVNGRVVPQCLTTSRKVTIGGAGTSMSFCSTGEICERWFIKLIFTGLTLAISN